MNIPELPVLLLEDALWSALAALGFAILFNVPTRTLPACALGGALGHVVRTTFVQFGLGLATATLFGATAVGFFSYVSAQRWESPSNVFAVPGVIPLVPGSLAFKTMIGILRMTEVGAAPNRELIVNTTVFGLETALILGGIAVGVIAPRLLFYRDRPIV